MEKNGTEIYSREVSLKQRLKCLIFSVKALALKDPLAYVYRAYVLEVGSTKGENKPTE